MSSRVMERLLFLFIIIVLLSLSAEKMLKDDHKFITVRFDDRKKNNTFIQETLKISDDEYDNRELVGWLCNDYLTEKNDAFSKEECVQLWDYVKMVTSAGSGSILDQVQVGQERFFTESWNEIKYNAHSSFSNGTFFRERKPLLLTAYATAVSSVTSTEESDGRPAEGLSYQTIWMMWWQGWQHAPPVVQKCYQSWKKHHPYWTIVLLDKDNVNQFFSVAQHLPHLDLSNTSDGRITSFSGIIRFALLYQYGGVWVDSTVYCHKPLVSFLWHIPATSGFFAFTAPGTISFLTYHTISTHPIKTLHEHSPSTQRPYFTLSTHSLLLLPQGRIFWPLISSRDGTLQVTKGVT